LFAGELPEWISAGAKSKSNGNVKAASIIFDILFGPLVVGYVLRRIPTPLISRPEK
jgi:hypothetical protein